MRRVLPALLPLALLAACSAPGGSTPVREADRPVLLDRVDDVAIAQLHADGFENLSPGEQALCWHLSRAAIAGRDIFLQQRCNDGLALRDLLEEILTHSDGIDPDTLAELRRYTKLFWVNNGPWNAITSRKSLLRCTPDALFAAAAVADQNGARLPRGCARGQSCRIHSPPIGWQHRLHELDDWFFAPAFEPMVTAKNPEGGLDIVQASSCTFYGDGVTLADLQGFDERYELNSTIVKLPDGTLEEQIWRAGLPEEGIPPGLYAAELSEVVACLTDALPFAPEPTRVALEKLIRFYRTGAVADREAYDIAWVADGTSAVDTINGFIEVYVDPRGKKGSFEGVVFYEDPHKAALIKGLADNAQWFEDHMPYAPEYRKPQVRGISARSIDVVCETGDGGPVTPVGINLPNDQRIREEHGSKSVSLSNVRESSDNATPSSMRTEFSWAPEEADRTQKFGALAAELLTDMHEVIGHASGQQAAGFKGTPQEAIKEHFSALEEGRADLVGLYFIADPKLAELGIVPVADQDAIMRAEYEGYTRNAIVQLRRVREGTQIEEDHMRNRQMIVRWLMANTKAIEQRTRDNKTYLVMVDPKAFREGVGKLLAEVQRIKSEGDFAAAKALFETHGIHFDGPLRDEVVKRVDSLNLPSYSGFVMPKLTAVKGSDGAITDIQISYPMDLTKQMLEYAAGTN